MQKYNKFIGIGLAIIIFIIPYSILLYIYLENTIPGGGFHLTMAQTAFVYNLIYIIPVGIVGIILIYKGNKLRKAKLLEIENLKKDKITLRAVF